VSALGKRFWLGSWREEREAAIACDRAVLFFGLPRALNLPRASPKLGPASPKELVRAARQKKKAEASASPFFGVVRDSLHSRWVAYIKVSERRHVRVAGFERENDAAEAYDRVARKVLGETALLNFPDRPLPPASIAEMRAHARYLDKLKATSRFNGVYRYVSESPEGRDAWCARVRINASSPVSLGQWESEEEAAVAYDRARLHYFGSDAALNFPKLAKQMGPADAATLREEARKAFKATTTSRFRGVCRENPKTSKWVSRIHHRGKAHFLGVFALEKDAALAYDKAATRLRGAKARLNFAPSARKRASPR
jgi:hypothetical protein